MFFRPKVKMGVFPILEIGPGAFPFVLSDIWLDKRFGSGEEFSQAGNQQPVRGKVKVYYDGGRFPFKDKSFKYAVASHVLEHVPWEEVPLFLSEMCRIADAGFIELPRWTLELIGDIPEHLLAGDVRDGKLHLYKKTVRHDFGFFTRVLSGKSRDFRNYLVGEKELFYCSLEWSGEIPHELHESGYPIAGGVSEITAALERDCNRHARSGSDVGDVFRFGRRIADYFRKTAVRVIAGRRRRLTEIADLLQCPICGQTIGPDYHCVGGDFSFIRSGDEFNPSQSFSRPPDSSGRH